jgi:hypothetical protein
MNEPNLGTTRQLSEIHKNRIGSANRGKKRKLTDEHKANIRRAQTEYYRRVKEALAHFEKQH